jgi:phenylacetate-coenzyme A ligase PaaK-like adenylate-forming protein
MLAPLAEAQTAGSLHIAPEKVITASEEQLPPARRAAIAAWGVQVINTYAATETATIASTCSHGSMHLYEDFVIIEPVDNAYRPVPDGHIADRLLATVLFSRTLPLIRYELTDSIRLATDPCTCGLPFRRLDTVAGRTEATLRVTSRTREPVLIRPGLFHDALEPLAIHGWQVQQTTEGITVRIVDPDRRVDLHQITRRLRAGLTSAGVTDDTHIIVTPVQELARTPLGKAPLIIGQKQGGPGGGGSSLMGSRLSTATASFRTSVGCSTDNLTIRPSTSERQPSMVGHSMPSSASFASFTSKHSGSKPGGAQSRSVCAQAGSTS